MSRFSRISGSLSARVALGYVLVAVVFAGAWLWSLYGPLTQAALRQQQRNLTAVAQSAALVAGNSDTTPAQVAEQLVARTDLRLTIVRSDGTVMADSNFDPAQMENHASRPEISQALLGEVGVDRRVSRTEKLEELYVAVPASVAGTRVAVRVSQPVAEIDAIASRSRRMGLLLLGGALLIAITIAVRTMRAAAQPIQDLSDAAERMAAGNLDVQVPAVPTDLEGLADALSTLRSQMRSRLAALEAEQRTLRATLDGLRDAVFVLDSTTIEFANSAAGRLFRAPRSGWSGTSLEQAHLPGGVEAAIVDRLTTGASLEPFKLEPDPTGRVLSIVVAPLDPSVPGARSIVSVSDVTRAARLDSVRRDFVANASHELKTPVAGIHLLAESAGAAAGDGDIEQALDFTRQIESETGRLQRLVGDLLDLSRLETAPEQGALTDARVAIDNAVLSHRSAAARKGLELRADLTAVRGADVFVAADPTDVAIALDNLLDNAITYTQQGSVTVSVETDRATVRFRVTDTGPGIAAEHQPRVFERFYRVDRGRSRDVGGTGLGLALVRHVAERNAGSVTLESEQGSGSTFIVTFPRSHWAPEAS